jgi:hypothetical protein
MHSICTVQYRCSHALYCTPSPGVSLYAVGPSQAQPHTQVQPNVSSPPFLRLPLFHFPFLPLIYLFPPFLIPILLSAICHISFLHPFPPHRTFFARLVFPVFPFFLKLLALQSFPQPSFPMHFLTSNFQTHSFASSNFFISTFYSNNFYCSPVSYLLVFTF